MTIDRWEVGPEYDDELFLKLGSVLKTMGFELGNKWSGMAGSQDITRWTVTSSEGSLVVESETYIGLSLEGSSDLVHLVREKFGAQRHL